MGSLKSHRLVASLDWSTVCHIIRQVFWARLRIRIWMHPLRAINFFEIKACSNCRRNRDVELPLILLFLINRRCFILCVNSAVRALWKTHWTLNVNNAEFLVIIRFDVGLRLHILNVASYFLLTNHLIGESVWFYILERSLLAVNVLTDDR